MYTHMIIQQERQKSRLKIKKINDIKREKPNKNLKNMDKKHNGDKEKM